MALRAARLAAGVTQEELAYRASLNVTYISLLENDHRSPSLEAIASLAEGLGLLPHLLVESAERRRT